jgi:hypothetical protein
LLMSRHGMSDGHPSNRKANPVAQVATATSALAVAILFSGTQGQAQISGFGQYSAPVYGGTESLPSSVTNPFSTVKGVFAPIHKTASGKPCISVHASAVPQVANPHIINHEVLVVNDCGQSIQIEVCYFQKSSCIHVAVGGYQKLERTLGISPGMTEFRYEYRELL